MESIAFSSEALTLIVKKMWFSKCSSVSIYELVPMSV